MRKLLAITTDPRLIPDSTGTILTCFVSATHSRYLYNIRSTGNEGGAKSCLSGDEIIFYKWVYRLGLRYEKVSIIK